MRTKLECSDEQFDGLHEALDKVRSTSTTVKVDKEALGALLRDQVRLLKAVGE
jgi:hypothetical protein